jgi:carbamoyl-phosphate synthase large subunit
MRVVENDAELERYIEEAVRVAPDKPILVDQFLADAVELDVDAVADGEDVLIGGVMEHVESAGVHSGDSACMIPPRSLDDATLGRVREVTEDIARALDTVGLLNVQLAVTGVHDPDADAEVYVLEANPRSSRTVPFVSKATGVPIAKLAAKVMTERSLAELSVDEQIPEHLSVKEVVLPFDRLPGSDPRLGPEMKSTGEVMGTARSLGKAYDKAQDATGKPIPESGTAVVDLSAEEFPDPDTDAGEALVERFSARFELSTATDLIEAARRGEIDLIISRQRDLLEVAVEEEITYFSTHASAKAALEAIDHAADDIDVMAVSDRPKRVANWGE